MEEVTKTDGRTILFVSHNMGAIEQLCNKCILIEKGKIKMFGETKKVINSYLEVMSKNMSTPLNERKDRTGAGNIRFEEIKFSGKTNSNIYEIGDDVDIHLKIKNTLPKDTPVNIILNILTATAQPLFSCDTLQKEQIFTLPASSVSKMTCKIIAPPLALGDYHINIGIIATNELEDRVAPAAEFSIKSGQFENHIKPNPYFPIFSKYDWKKE